MIPTRQDIIHTIKLTPADRRRLVDAMEKMAARSAWSREKRQMRVPYPAEELTLHVGGEPGSHGQAVISRNLSRWGISFLIGRFVYPDSDTTLDLRRLDGRVQAIRARILRCRHVSKMVHEVSALFDEPIDLTQFVDLSPEDRRRLDLERAGRLPADDTNDHEDEPVLSSFDGPGPLQGVLESVVRSTTEFTTQLRTAVEKSDLTLLDTLARQLAGLGEGCGFGPLSASARSVTERIADADTPPADIFAAADSLLDVLRRLRCEVGSAASPVTPPRD